MKISEALRKGSKIRPQCKGLYFKDGCSCSLGAIFEAIGVATPESQSTEITFLRKYYPQADNIVEHPVDKRKTYLSAVILALNDYDNWTREQIADWLESIGE